MAEPSPIDPQGDGESIAVAPCDRCGSDSAITTAADSAGFSAELCADCGHAWLLAVVTDWDASLPVYVGTATTTQASEHAAKIAARDAAEDAVAARKAREAQRAREAKQQRNARMEADRSAKASECAAVVVERPGIDAQALADALGVSRRSLGRITKLASDRGLIERPGGFNAGYRPIAQPLQRPV